MAIRNIFKDDAPCLYKVARPVEKFDEKLFKLLDDMAETMYAADGVGLAGPQIGILRQYFVTRIMDLPERKSSLAATGYNRNEFFFAYSRL